MHNTRSSVERLDTQVSSLHHDVAALSMEVNMSTGQHNICIHKISVHMTLNKLWRRAIIISLRY